MFNSRAFVQTYFHRKVCNIFGCKLEGYVFTSDKLIIRYTVDGEEYKHTATATDLILYLAEYGRH
ncbi:hypothetical protein Q21_gp59 [Vibrio phage VPp1]|nr:hypothetical protein Q21_gp59 [Vibrio phage VPp1]